MAREKREGGVTVGCSGGEDMVMGDGVLGMGLGTEPD